MIHSIRSSMNITKKFFQVHFRKLQSFFYSNKKFSEGFKSIGTAILLHISDNFKFLTLNVKKGVVKLFHFNTEDCLV